MQPSRRKDAARATAAYHAVRSRLLGILLEVLPLAASGLYTSGFQSSGAGGDGSSLRRPSQANWPSVIGATAALLGLRWQPPEFLQSPQVEAPLARWLPELDAKAKKLDEDAWTRSECAALARKIISGAPRHAGGGEIRLVHTGAFLEHWERTGEAAPAVQKLRLSVLSFLATQDLSRTRLHIWTDIDVARNDTTLAQALHPILVQPELKRSIVLRRFDAGHEFQRVSRNSAVLLQGIYDKDSQLAAKSDLQRVIILYNYGGMWVDTDVLLIQDLSPLMGVDWAYLGQTDLINNAVLSVSAPRSLFATSYLMALVSQHVTPNHDTTYFRYGAIILSDLFREEWMRRTFHVLPPCFFDGRWSGAGAAPSWDTFFSNHTNTFPVELAYLYPKNARRGAFAYHWHGRWHVPIANESTAYAIEHVYAWLLHLDLDGHKF